MFRFHTTNDLISEISKEIDRSKYAAQIVVDEMDLFFLNDSLLRNIDRISLEIIIISNSNKKSLKVINLVKRLVDCQAEVHWFNNNLLYVNESFFAIFDKFYLLDKEILIWTRLIIPFISLLPHLMVMVSWETKILIF